ASDVFELATDDAAALRHPVEEVLRDGVKVAPPGHRFLRRKDGSRLAIAESCAPVLDSKGHVRGAVLVFRDVSRDLDSRHLQEVAQQKIILSERMASIGTLAAGVAHEINNPLTYVLANLDMIRDEFRARSAGASFGDAKELEDMATEAFEG